MSRAARTVLVFGVYLIVVGVGLVVIPNTVLGPLGFPASHEIWPRVVGVLALCLSYYYIAAARTGHALPQRPLAGPGSKVELDGLGLRRPGGG
ncbi:MAG: hypothetical protein EXS42_05500 [Lacunisphaera sp.]|nr:hypothetical protein [Lacunisphaera sp.]